MNTTVIYYKHADEVVTDWAIYIANLSIVCLIREYVFRPKPVVTDEDFFNVFKICSGEAIRGFFCDMAADLAGLVIPLLRTVDFYVSMVLLRSITYTINTLLWLINLLWLIVIEFMTIILFFIALTTKFTTIIINGVD